jgi:hypothetical protein
MARSDALRLSAYGRENSPGFGQTIVNVPKRTALRSLCVEESDTLQPQAATSQRLFKVRLVDGSGHREATGLLVRRRYAWRGYNVGTGEAIHPNRATFSACDGDEVVATISVGLDSIAGLFVDKLYNEEIDAIRAANGKVCEFTKLAIEASIRSRPVLAALFHIAYIHARRINRCTDLFIEVNPRHVAFYRTMLGFEESGPERLDPRVGACAVLMRLDLGYAQREIAELGGRAELARSQRSLYPYFFAPDEECQVERRLRAVR